jgi:hypothetical protein
MVDVREVDPASDGLSANVNDETDPIRMGVIT